MRLKDIFAVFGIGVSHLFVTSVVLRAKNQRTARIRTSAAPVPSVESVFVEFPSLPSLSGDDYSPVRLGALLWLSQVVSPFSRFYSSDCF